jgi:hypothetical protein
MFGSKVKTPFFLEGEFSLLKFFSRPVNIEAGVDIADAVSPILGRDEIRESGLFSFLLVSICDRWVVLKRENVIFSALYYLIFTFSNLLQSDLPFLEQQIGLDRISWLFS